MLVGLEGFLRRPLRLEVLDEEVGDQSDALDGTAGTEVNVTAAVCIAYHHWARVRGNGPWHNVVFWHCFAADRFVEDVPNA